MPMKKKPQINPDKELKRLGNRIKQLRVKAGFTSYEYFAYEHEISRTQYARYEQGKDLRYSTLLKIINAHGITVKQFFAEGFEE
jgi:transcriptional regulator with XRE-family HTH domain